MKSPNDIAPNRIAMICATGALALCFASSVGAKTTAAASDEAGGLVTADAGYGPQGAHEGPGGGERHRGGDPERAASHLRAVLQLTPAQEPALQAFLASMHPPRPADGEHAHEPLPVDPAARKAEMDRRMAEMRSRREDMEKKRAAEAALTTPQRLDEMVKHMQDRMAKRQSEMQARIAAIKQFYAALTPSQQKAFDALHGGMMGGMGHQRGWGRGGMHLGMMDRPSPPMPPMPPQLGMRPPPPPEPPASPGN